MKWIKIINYNIRKNMFLKNITIIFYLIILGVLCEHIPEMAVSKFKAHLGPVTSIVLFEVK